MDNDPKNTGLHKLDKGMLQRWRSASLDEAMEQIFHPSTDRFSLADLGSSQCVETNYRFCERDYQSHRRESLHHHQPLHKLYHRHKRSSSHKVDQEEAASSRSVPPSKERIAEQEPTAEDALISIPEETQSDGQVERVRFYVDSPPSSQSSCVPTPKRTLTGRFNSVLQNFSVPFRSGVKKHPQKGKSSQIAVSPSLTLPSTSNSTSEHALLPTCSTDVPILEVSDVDSSPGLSREQSDLTDGKQRVKFEVGEEVLEEPEKPNDKKVTRLPTPSKRVHRHVKKYHRHGSLKKRQHQGSDLESKVYHDVLEPEEAEMLQTADIEDLASHRFDDPKAIRRHKISDKNSVSSFMQLSKKDSAASHMSHLPVKKKYDHQPHEIFVELDELHMDEPSQEYFWRETARWIKYEEDVEVSVDRWGKPHVPSLSFHSLINLRHCLESGVIILDLEESDFLAIVEKTVDAMITSDELKAEQKMPVITKLLVRHRHANEKSHPPLFLRRSAAAHASMGVLGHEKRSPRFLRPTRNKTDNEIYHTHENHKTNSTPETAVLIPNDSMKNVEMISAASMKNNMSSEEVSKVDSSILRRIPVNAEGTTVLVGAINSLDKSATAFVRLSEGRIIPHLLEIPIPVRFLFILLGPTDSDLDYHEIGRSISTLMSNRAFHEAAYQATERKDLLSAINIFLDDSVVLPPGDVIKSSLLPVSEIRRKSIQYRKKALPTLLKAEEPMPPKPPAYDPLQRTGRYFGGFIQDIRNRFPWYLSDIYDGLNMQCIASAIFIYFAALSGAIAFGGLLGDKTKQLIGVSETLIATCFSGILFSALACQPLVILGTTGPVLLFDEILFSFCQNQEMDFLRLRVWIGIWTALIGIVVVAFEGSAFVRFFSRFMQEIYATIISVMFIFESFSKLYQVFLEHPLLMSYEDTGQGNSTHNYSTSAPIDVAKPNTSLLSTMLMIGTFYIALFLRHFRNSIFLGRSARRALGDFGVPIAMSVMVAIDYAIRDVYTQKLNVPNGLSPSSPDVRGWLISPWPISVSEFFIAALAGLLIFILLFLEALICEQIISKKERKLKKGSGFHADMLLVSFISIGCSLIGGPWMSAATVRSISHVSSLTLWSKTHAPGEAPHIVEVKEQRLTNFCVALLVGVSVLMTPVLRQVPVAVLFGVFLYMGVSALSGIQLYERFLLLFVPTKHHPDVVYVKRVRTSRMHLYTVIQLICIAVLWTIKSTILAPGFPVALLLLILLHYLLKKCFSPEEIQALDGESQEEEVKESEPDFYEQIVA